MNIQGFDKNSEFYVGYLPEMPLNTKNFLRKGLVVLFLTLPLSSLLLGYFQDKMDRGTFEFGVKRNYTGTLFVDPIPMIYSGGRSYILVGDGKFGGRDWAEKWNQKANQHEIIISATLIERSPLAMLEIDREATAEILTSQAMPLSGLVSEKLGEVELQGELVDSKCYLGVMRPAVGKVHRGCAIRCLSGGVPPGLLLRNASIDASVLILLAGPKDEKLEFNPEWAARNIKVKGNLEMKGGVPIMSVQTLSLVE